MGYWAKGSGSCTLKNDVDTKELDKKIRDALGIAENVICDDDLEWEIDESSKMINFWESDSHWHEEDTYLFLNTLIPFIVDGCADYNSNEDDSIWRYKFNPETKAWDEQDATVDYNFESYSDEEMIRELQNRGYRVVRKD